MPEKVSPPSKEAPAPAAAAPRRKARRSVPHARACVRAGLNNTIVTITDDGGNTVAWASAGSCGFKGSRKSTPYAAKVAAEKAAEKVQGYGIQSISVEVKGIGPGRDQALRGLQGAGFDFDRIVDKTPIAHGGCRPKRRRRI